MKVVLNNFSEIELKKLITDAVHEEFKKLTLKKDDIKYLTREETASKLHISLPTLNKYTKHGILRGYKINGRVLYKKNEVDDALTVKEPLKYHRG